DGSQTRATIAPTSIGNLTLNGLDGDDLFNVTGPQPYTSIVLAGGNPSASDTAKLTGASGAVTVNLADSTIPTNTTITGYNGTGTVTLTGIEVANLDANSNTVTVMGTGGSDSLTVSPTGAAAATLTNAGLNSTFNFTTVSTAAGGFSVNGNGGTDQLAVQ